jgi:hypothetical protein
MGGVVARGLVGGIGRGFLFPTIRRPCGFSRGGVMMWKFLIASIEVSNIVWASVPLARFNLSAAA